MENEFNKIDDLFRDSFSDYSETPPPAVWPALEKRLDERKKRRVFPLLRWYWLGALLAFVSLLGATLLVDMKDIKPAAPELADNAVLPLNTAPELHSYAPKTKPSAVNAPAGQTQRTAAPHSSETRGGVTRRNIKHTINEIKRNDRTNKRDEEQVIANAPVAAAETPTSKNAPAVGTSVYSYDDFEEEEGAQEKQKNGAEAIAGNDYAPHATGKHKIVVVEATGEALPSHKDELNDVSAPAAAVSSSHTANLVNESDNDKVLLATTHLPAKPRVASRSHSASQVQSGASAKESVNIEKPVAVSTKRAVAAMPTPHTVQNVAAHVQKSQSPSRLPVGATASVSGMYVNKAERKLKNGKAQVAETAAAQYGSAYSNDNRKEKARKDKVVSNNAGQQAQSAKVTGATVSPTKANAEAKPVAETLVATSASPSKPGSARLNVPNRTTPHSKGAAALSGKAIVSSVGKPGNEQEKPSTNEDNAALPAQIPHGSLVRAEESKLPALSKLPATSVTQKAIPGKNQKDGNAATTATLHVGNTPSLVKHDVAGKAEKVTINESAGEKKSTAAKTVARPNREEEPLAAHEPAVASATKSSVVAKPVVNAKAKVPPVIAATAKAPEGATKEKPTDVSPSDMAKAPVPAGAKQEVDSAALSQMKLKAEEQKPDSSVDGITPLMKFVFGIKGGLESGFSVKAGNKLVVAPYVRYNFNDKLGIVLQPSMKLGRVSARVMGSPTAYHNIHAGTGQYQLDSQSLVYLPFTGETLVRRDYTYTEKYDSIVKQNQVGGTYVEFELPVLLQYQVSKRLSILGGFNVVMGRRFSIVEKTKTYNDVTATGNPFTLSGLNQPGVLPVATGVNYTSSPISSYSGPSFPANNSNLVRMGYMLGASYEWKKRWTMDVTIQQCFVQKNIQGGFNLNSALSAPYFRFSIGYRLTK